MLGGVVSVLLLLLVVLQVATLPSPISVSNPFKVLNNPMHVGDDVRVVVNRCLDESKIPQKQVRYQTVTTRVLTNQTTGDTYRFPELSPYSDVSPGCSSGTVIVSYLPDDVVPGVYVLSGVVSLVGVPRISRASAEWTTEPFQIVP